ncbi:hypothetical protein M9Y10_045039 [Tritrichomonas musculus]|uniref:Uncharacterized protein n=1 Tax=Tritrichomonas musculus TaxID=1915356 RepID=A0ABR2JU50_9EUKA
MKPVSNDVNRHKENFQFLGNSIKDKNPQRKLNKATLEISSSEISPSPIKFKSLSQSNKDQLSIFLSDQFISPSRSHKDQIPNMFEQKKIISPSLSNISPKSNHLDDKKSFVSPSLPAKELNSSLLSPQTPIDSPVSLNNDQIQNLVIDQKSITTPSSAQSLKDSQPVNYELKYKKARQKIKGMKIIIDVLNARVQKTVSNKQDLEKQISELKQQLYDSSQSQIMSNNNSVRSISAAPDSQSQISSELHSQSSISNKNEDQDRINNVFDKISRFEKTCDSAIQAFNEFQSLISSPASTQNQSLNLSSRNITQESPKPPIPNKTSFSSTTTPINPQSYEMLKKKNKQLQAKIEQNNEAITQLNAKIRRRENENSMLKQQINDLENSLNMSKKNDESKVKRVQEYLCNLQQRFSKMQKEGNNNLTNQNSDIIQILKDNEALAKRVKELSMKNSELVRIIYKMQKENPTEKKPLNNLQNKEDSILSPKPANPPSKPSDSPKSDLDKVEIPMSVKYSFNPELEYKNQDDPGVSCFVE